jgi:hypothetical protein
MSSLVILILAIVGALALVAVGILIWLRQNLLSNVVTVDVDSVDPALRKKIDALELEYAIAEELDYPGEILVHLEAKLNAAKLEASGDPNAILTVLVVAPEPPVVVETQPGVFTITAQAPLLALAQTYCQLTNQAGQVIQVAGAVGR